MASTMNRQAPTPAQKEVYRQLRAEFVLPESQRRDEFLRLCQELDYTPLAERFGIAYAQAQELKVMLNGMYPEMHLINPKPRNGGIPKVRTMLERGCTLLELIEQNNTVQDKLKAAKHRIGDALKNDDYNVRMVPSADGLSVTFTFHGGITLAEILRQE